MLRSIRYGEADRVLHLYTADRGRVGAVAKGVRRVKSRLGGRLEPLSRVKLVLHQGRGELCTISQADTVHAHAGLREHRASLERGAQACEAVLRLLDSTDPNPPAYNLLCNELALLDERPEQASRAQALAFRLKLLLAAGFAPELAVLRRLRRGRAPGRLLAERRRRGVRRLRGGLVPARRRGARLPGAGDRPPAGRGAGRAASGRSPRPTARSRRRWSTTRTSGCGAWRRFPAGERQAGLRLHRGLARHARAARRKGRERRRDDARARRRARARRLHDHDRGLRRVHEERRGAGRGDRRRPRAARGAGRHEAGRRRATRCSCPCEAARASRCPGCSTPS